MARLVVHYTVYVCQQKICEMDAVPVVVATPIHFAVAVSPSLQSALKVRNQSGVNDNPTKMFDIKFVQLA